MSSDQEANPYQPPLAASGQRAGDGPPKRLPLAIGWALIMAIAGGFACGWLMTWHPLVGAIALWPLGSVGGNGSRRLTIGPSLPAAWCLVTACVVAMLIAQVCWLHWNTVQGEDGWGAAIELLGTYYRNYSTNALIEACFAAFGAFAAYSSAGRRYRIVREYID
jgi:hypothetical protein